MVAKSHWRIRFAACYGPWVVIAKAVCWLRLGFMPRFFLPPMQTAAPPRTRIVGPEPFRNLGFPGVVVAALVSSFFAAQIVCNLAVLILYGRHAFFVQGLRVADWKHAILSNGVRLPWWGNLMIGPPIVPVAALLIFGAEFAAGRGRAFLDRKPAWTTALTRLVGGARTARIFLLALFAATRCSVLASHSAFRVHRRNGPSLESGGQRLSQAFLGKRITVDALAVAHDIGGQATGTCGGKGWSPRRQLASVRAGV